MKREGNKVVASLEELLYLVLPKSKVAWTLPDLIRMTAQIMKSRSREQNCITTLTTKPDESKLEEPFYKSYAWIYHTTCASPDSSKTGWDQQIGIDINPKKDKKFKSWNDVDVRLTCTCPAFQYWGPERNALLNDYILPPPKGEPEKEPKSNLKFKDGTPWTQAFLCKHLVRAAQDLITKQLPGYKGKGFLGKLWGWIKGLFGKKKKGSLEKYSGILVQDISSEL